MNKTFSIILLMACVAIAATAQRKSITYYHHGSVTNTGQSQGGGGWSVKVVFEDGEPQYTISRTIGGDERKYWFESDYDNDGVYYKKEGSSDKYRFSDDLSCMICSSPAIMGGMVITNVYYNYPLNGSSGYNGGGYSGGSHNGGSSGRAYTTCRTCGGSGVCTSCNGRRGYYVDSGTYTGYNTQVWKDCPSCNGTGRCFNCHGKGKY